MKKFGILYSNSQDKNWPLLNEDESIMEFNSHKEA